LKLLRYGPVGYEQPGLVDAQGRVRDLSLHTTDITPAFLYETCSASLHSIAPPLLPRVAGSPRLGVPIAGSPRVIAVEPNFPFDSGRSKAPCPGRPAMSMSATGAAMGPHDDLDMPPGCTTMDCQVKLGVVIGRRASCVEAANSLDYVFGYVVVHELSERLFQRKSWIGGHPSVQFGPVGPWLVSKDEVDDVENLRIWLNVNGRRAYAGTTRTMFLSVARLVHYVSQLMELEPGDIITTSAEMASRAGQGLSIPLNGGDIVELGIERLGAQKHKVYSRRRRGMRERLGLSRRSRSTQ
jgi:2,4-didehydro-3-deoxy-L-rhamnonate hydrolase